MRPPAKPSKPWGCGSSGRRASLHRRAAESPARLRGTRPRLALGRGSCVVLLVHQVDHHDAETRAIGFHVALASVEIQHCRAALLLVVQADQRRTARSSSNDLTWESSSGVWPREATTVAAEWSSTALVEDEHPGVSPVHLASTSTYRPLSLYLRSESPLRTGPPAVALTQILVVRR
jgi:hypothetical protein